METKTRSVRKRSESAICLPENMLDHCAIEKKLEEGAHGSKHSYFATKVKARVGIRAFCGFKQTLHH